MNNIEQVILYTHFVMVAPQPKSSATDPCEINIVHCYERPHELYFGLQGNIITSFSATLPLMFLCDVRSDCFQNVF